MSNKILHFINLHNGEEDKQKVLENVRSSISFRGSNLWILACAIVIASVGLNINSAAVIIGAMLISPLMGPIVGAGFALGIYDFTLLKRSGKNLLIATLVSLFVASLYFFISPFKETQSELLARTSPNIYDVLIAFFGGLVGVIAITRVEKGNPIPGVAIATALMPPLCTAGYGIAIGNFQYFFGAFYLYSINCFFICIATFFIVKYLKYPPASEVRTKLDRQIRNGISILIIIMILPSCYLAYELFMEKQYIQNIETFLNKEFSEKGHAIVYKKIYTEKNPRLIELAFLTKKFKKEEIQDYNNKLEEQGIRNTTLKIVQDARDVKTEILNEINIHRNVINDKDEELGKLKNELKKYKMQDEKLIKEINILFPEIREISFGKHIINQGTDSIKPITVFVYKTNKKNDKTDITKLKEWLKQKTNSDEIKLLRDN